MRIKKFYNLWTMGLIASGAILVFLYFLKLVFPEYYIGVAQNPNIVKFGELVDGNIWTIYLFNFVTSFVALYFYTCACCRIKKLKATEMAVEAGIIIGSYLVEMFLPEQSLAYNFIGYLIIPLLVACMRKLQDPKIFYSTCICFIATTFAQSLSLSIRDISTAISYPNTATYFVLLIDGYIWNILLYNYFNFRREQQWAE